MDPTSAHPKSLINNIPFSPALRFRKIYSETSELNKHLNDLKEFFINRGCKEHFLTDQFNQKSEVTKEVLLISKQKIVNKQRIPLVLKFNRTLPNIKKVIDEHWHLLQINPKLKNAFQGKPIITYKRNRNLKEIIGSNKILNNKVIRKKKAEKKHLFCSSCYARRDNLCCQQKKKTNVFKSCKTGKTYKIFHQLTCKSQAIIYLFQCRICFIQYVGKSETTFNLRLNNHRKDSKKKDAILACTHFQKSNHIFQRDAKFVLIE